MLELPLFPLKTVLFPGATIRLHIFEERYKRMIALCLSTHQPFGVVMIRHGEEAAGPLAEPYSVGCSVQIIQVQRLEEGRMNLTGIGLEKFRIISLERHAQPYLVGTVEPFPLSNPDPFVLAPAEKHLRMWVSRYVAAIARANAGQVDVDQLPADPEEFVYAAAGLLQISPAEKQDLLTMETSAELVMGVTALYKREVALARTIFGPGPDFLGTFSLN